MGVAVGSNILVRYIAKDDERLLKEAVVILEKAKQASLVVDRIVIAETGYVLRSVYGLKKDSIVLAYRSMLSNPVFTITDPELTELTIALFASEIPLSFEDCWLLALQRSGKVSSVATFDKNLAKRL